MSHSSVTTLSVGVLVRPHF